jgi:exopolysaccharide biosynthesis predicted pyruvyltransferase EpsI
MGEDVPCELKNASPSDYNPGIIVVLYHGGGGGENQGDLVVKTFESRRHIIKFFLIFTDLHIDIVF